MRAVCGCVCVPLWICASLLYVLGVSMCSGVIWRWVSRCEQSGLSHALTRRQTAPWDPRCRPSPPRVSCFVLDPGSHRLPSHPLPAEQPLQGQEDRVKPLEKTLRNSARRILMKKQSCGWVPTKKGGSSARSRLAAATWRCIGGRQMGQPAGRRGLGRRRRRGFRRRRRGAGRGRWAPGPLISSSC